MHLNRVLIHIWLSFIVLLSLVLIGCTVETPTAAPPVEEGSDAVAEATSQTESTSLPAEPAEEVEPSPTPAPVEPVTLVYWDWFNEAEGEYIDAQLRAFEEAHPGIVVERNNIPDSTAYNEALALTFGNEQQPDVFELPRRVRLADFQQYVMPLNRWMTPEWQSNFAPGTFSEGSTNVSDGDIYSFPFQGSGNVLRVLYLNTSLFERAGLMEDGVPRAPTTYSEMRGFARQITEACQGDCYGFGFGGKDAGNAFGDLIDIAQYGGGSFYSLDGFNFKTGQYAYGSNSAYSDMMRLVLDMKADGSIIPEAMSLDTVTAEALFAEGEIAMLIGKHSVATTMLRNGFDQFEIVAPPVPDSGQKGFWYYQPGSNQWYMSADTQHPEEAWMLMDWFASREFAEGWVKAELGIVAHEEANRPDYAQSRHFAKFIELVNTLVKLAPSYRIRNPETSAVSPEPVSPDWPEVFVGIYTGQLELDTALSELDERKQTALEAAIADAQATGADVSIEDFIFSDWNQMEDYVTEPAE